MTAGLGWLAAFPHREADRAVHAIRKSWDQQASKPRPQFGPKINEPKLTRVLRLHAMRVTARELGLLGYWGAEGVENDVDFETGEILDETRTDILYAWNDASQSLRLVFEFKKLNHQESTRKKYLGKSGMLRFVTGPYSEKQAVAIMAAILTVDERDAVPPLRRALQHPATAQAVAMVEKPGGGWLHIPSDLFPKDVEFDTEHLRSPELGPAHGTIRVAHMFLPFGYELPAPRRTRKAILDELEQP